MDWLSGWYNWPFLLSFFVGCGLIALTLLGVSGDSDVDGDGIPDALETDHHHTHVSALEWLGLGKAPLSVLLQTALISFGLTGMLVNAACHDLFVGWWDAAAFPMALVLGFAAAVAATGGVGRMFAVFMPPENATSRKPGEFVGRLGTAATRITLTIGQVRLSGDEEVTLLNAFSDPAMVPTIERGAEVHIVGYDSERRMYRIIPVQTT